MTCGFDADLDDRDIHASRISRTSMLLLLKIGKVSPLFLAFRLCCFVALCCSFVTDDSMFSVRQRIMIQEQTATCSVYVACLDAFKPDRATDHCAPR